MRVATVVIVVAVLLIPIRANEDQVSPYFSTLKESALKFLSTRPDSSDIRMLTTVAIPEKDLPTRINTMNFWINNLHFKQKLTKLREVPGSDKQLWWISLTDYGWNKEAWDSVADRDHYRNLYRDDRITLLTGSKHSILRMDSFFRETVEQERSDAYFDLLFADKRFRVEPTVVKKGEKFYWPGGNDKTGKYFAPGFYTRGAEYGKETVKQNFPKNEEQWEGEFGVDIVRRFIAQKGIDTRKRAVVDKGFSIVARNNRMIEGFVVPYGYYYKTYDVDKTAGKKDFVRTLHFGFEFDAGENIVKLPGGGQAYLLVDNKGQIVPIADGKFAIDTSDVGVPDKEVGIRVPDARVRNPGSCIVCHESGLINPQNIVKETLEASTRILAQNKDPVKAKQLAGEIEALYLYWETKLQQEQKQYQEFIKRTSGYEAGENSTKFKEFRDWYDRHLTVDQAAREIGLTKEQFIAATIKMGDPRLAILINPNQGYIPRDSWEELVPRLFGDFRK